MRYKTETKDCTLLINNLGRFVFFLCLTFFSSCIIEMAPARLSDDGYSHYIETAKKDTLSSGLLKSQPLKKLNADEGKIYEIDNVFIDSMSLKHDKMWVIIWAIWCPKCLAYIEEEINYAKTNNIKLVLVSSNYDIVHIKKWYKKYSYNGNIYIVKASTYSSDESKKIIQFSNQLYKEEKNVNYTPQYFYYLNGKLVHSKQGIPPDYSQIK